MDNYINLLMFGGLSVFMLFLFIFMLKREKIIEQKFSAIELTLEELHKEIYLLKKQNINESVQKEIEKIENIIDSIVDDIRVIESKNIEIIESLKKQIQELYSEIKKNKLPEISTLSKSDEEKIINMYKNGYSIEDISRALRIPAGEIELILKFSSF